MNNSDKVKVAGLLAFMAAMVAMIVGWVINMFAVIHMVQAGDIGAQWALLLVRALGIVVAPLGGLLGLFG